MNEPIKEVTYECSRGAGGGGGAELWPGGEGGESNWMPDTVKENVCTRTL